MNYKLSHTILSQIENITKFIISPGKNRFKYFLFVLIFLSCDLILYTNVDEYKKAKSQNHLYAYNTKNLYAAVSKKDVVLYGNKNCYFCNKLKKQLTREGIPFDFYDVSESDYRYEEMRRKFMRAFPDSNVVHFPMVQVKGKILMRPSVEEIRSYLAY